MSFDFLGFLSLLPLQSSGEQCIRLDGHHCSQRRACSTPTLCVGPLMPVRRVQALDRAVRFTHHRIESGGNQCIAVRQYSVSLPVYYEHLFVHSLNLSLLQRGVSAIVALCTSGGDKFSRFRLK